MNTLYTHPAHTCVDRPTLPCPACIAAQLVLHPEHGYYKPSAAARLADVHNERSKKGLS